MRYEKLTKVDRNTGKPMGWRWKFWEYSDELQRNRVVPIDQIPTHIRESQDEREVDAYVRSQNALNDAKKFRAEQRLKWKEKYSDFSKLLERFTAHHQERAPNSWDTDVYYLEAYVFHFYLDLKNYNNLYDWKFHFDDFKAWLREIKPIKVRKDRLAKNTQNKCIKALNLFMAWAFKTNVINELPPKCEVYSREQLPQVQPEDLFSVEEIGMIVPALEMIRPVSARLFRLLVNSGLRINEALGVCLPFIVEGQIDGEHSKRMHAVLELYGMDKYFGYIVLMNQPELDSIRTDEDFESRITGKKWMAGQVPRKALKSRIADRPDEWRLIPIYDKATWNMIVDLWSEQDSLFEKRVNGTNPQDYLLFEGLTPSMFYSDLKEALESLKLRFRSAHKCRHTYLSWFYGNTNDDSFLAKKVGGHKDQKSREVYSHLAQQIGLEQRLASQSKRKLKRVE